MNEQYEQSQKSTQQTSVYILSGVIALLVVTGAVYGILTTLRITAFEESMQVSLAEAYDRLDALERAQSAQEDALQRTADLIEEEKKNPAIAIGEVLYRNEEYKFSITFPESWGDVQAESRDLDWGTLGAIPSFNFGFEEQTSLFNVSVFTKAQWQSLQKQGGLSPTYMGESTVHVFAYSQAQDAESTEIAERMSEVPEIVKTFKVLE